MAEDRERFRDLLDSIAQPYAPSAIVEGATEAERAAATARALEDIGLPAIVRPAFTLGGTGGGIVATPEAYEERVRAGLRLSPIGQVMVERYLAGWQEIEYEVMRDAADTCIAVCSMENVDPLGVHTGDSIVVAPVQTLPDPVHQRLRTAALDIIRALGVEGGCNVQFALSPDAADYAVIEVNPRVSRSSALASKATGYPIARVAAQIAIGRRLDEIPNAITGTTVAAFEPALDYVVVKLPRFPFDKFPGAERTLGSQMKATGEVMAIDRTFGAALNKALRGLEQAGAGFLAEDPAWRRTLDVLAGWASSGRDGEPAAIPSAADRGEGRLGEFLVDGSGLISEDGHDARPTDRAGLLLRFLQPSDSRLWRSLALLRRGVAAGELQRVTGIAPWFLSEMERLAELERRMRDAGDGLSDDLLVSAKRASFSDRDIGTLTGLGESEVRRRRHAMGLRPGYAMVDTCAAEFAAETPYFYATYAAGRLASRRLPPVPRPAALVIGSGPVRIGQGIEFDYCAVQAAQTLRADGQAAVMINSNPETVSTDFDASSRLYFEPLDAESVLEVIDAESVAGEGPLPALVQFGGQTPLNLAAALAAAGVPLPGIDLEAIERTEERTRFAQMVDAAGHPAAARRHGDLARGGARGGRGGRLPGAGAALLRHRRPGHRLLLRPRGPGAAAGHGHARERGAAGAHRCLPRGPGGRRRCRDRRAGRAHPRAHGARRAGRRPLRRQRGGLPAAAALGRRPGAHRDGHAPHLPRGRRARPRQRPVHRPRRRRLRAGGQPARQPHGALPVQGDRRAHGGAGHPGRTGCHARGAGLARRTRSPPPGLVAVKAPVFSTAKLRGVDPSAGSRHAVDGRGHRPARGLRGGHGQGAAGGIAAATAARTRTARLPSSRSRRVTRGGSPSWREHWRTSATASSPPPARQPACDGWATRCARRPCWGRLDDGLPSILDVIASGEVSLVVNTPAPRSGAVLDAAAIRHAAVAEGILCLTDIDTAVAAARSLDPAAQARVTDVRSLDAWLGGGTGR